MRLMIDIETLGENPDAVVTSLVAYDMDNKKVLINASFEIESQLRNKRTVDWSVIKFWIKQGVKNPEAAMLLVDAERENVYKKDVLLDLWLHMKTATEIWAKSPSFDMVILSHLFKSIAGQGTETFRKELDVRTVMKYLTPLEISEIRAKYDTLHDPVKDCEYQTELVELFEKKMKGISL